MNKYTFTDKELQSFENMTQDLILTLFESKQKRFDVKVALKKAYLKGYQQQMKDSTL